MLREQGLITQVQTENGNETEFILPSLISYSIMSSGLGFHFSKRYIPRFEDHSEDRGLKQSLIII